MSDIDDAASSMDRLIESIGAPLLRGGLLNRLPREQMDGYKWHLIYERDGGFCYLCGNYVPKGSGEVDHVVPRSSFPEEKIGLADRSDNLRTTHVECNQRKSNYLLGEDAVRTSGVTARCWECTYDRGFDADLDPEGWEEHREQFPRPLMNVTAFCGSCGSTWVPDESWLM